MLSFSRLLVIKHPNIEIKPPTLSKVNKSKSDAKPAVKAQVSNLHIMHNILLYICILGKKLIK